jgi:hypothetical protein
MTEMYSLYWVDMDHSAVAVPPVDDVLIQQQTNIVDETVLCLVSIERL